MKKTLGIIAVLLMCGLTVLFLTLNNKDVRADDVAYMTTLNQVEERLQEQINTLNTNIIELKAENKELQNEIIALKKTDKTLANNISELETEIKNANTNIKAIQTREKYFYDKTSKGSPYNIMYTSRYILSNLY